MKQGWEMIKLSEVCDIKTGKKDVNQGNPNGVYPFFTCAKEHTYSDTFSFDAEALLIAGNGDVGNVSYYSGKFEAYQRTYVLLNFKRIQPQYLYMVLDGTLKSVMAKNKLGNTMPYIKLGMLKDFEIPLPNISQIKIKNTKIPLPPLPEQQRIVSILDEAFEAIAKAKANAEQNLQNAKDLFESYLQGVFENKGDGWEEKTLGEICEKISRGIPPKYIDKNGVIVLNQKCIRDHKISLEPSRLHDIYNKNISADKYIQLGDVLVNSTGVGTLGRVAQVRDLPSESVTVDTHISIVRPLKEKFYLDFFGWAMIFIENQIENSGAGASGQTELARTVLENNFTLAYPKSLTKQQTIVKKLDALSTVSKKLETIYQQKINDLEELKKSILQKAFAGELKTSDIEVTV